MRWLSLRAVDALVAVVCSLPVTSSAFSGETWGPLNRSSRPGMAGNILRPYPGSLRGSIVLQGSAEMALVLVLLSRSAIPLISSAEAGALLMTSFASVAWYGMLSGSPCIVWKTK